MIDSDTGVSSEASLLRYWITYDASHNSANQGHLKLVSLTFKLNHSQCNID